MRKFLLLFLIPILAYAIDRDVTSRDGGVVVNGFTSIKNQVNGVDKLTINSAGLTLGTSVNLLPGLGTVLLPSYSFSGDTNTGVWSPGADSWAVSTGGAEKLRVDSFGNVGINTFGTATSPSLNISNAGSAASNGGILRFGDTQVGSSVDLARINAYKIFGGAGQAADLVFQISTSNTLSEAMRIASSGNVGVGVVAGATGGLLNIGVLSNLPNSTYAGGTKVLELQGKSGSAFSEPKMVFTENGNVIASIAAKNESAYTGSLIFSTNNTASAANGDTERVRIAANGNVGIGKTPTTTLDVNGVVKATSFSGFGSVPIGSIIAWSGGYFTNGANAGFTNVLGNTVANVNTYLSGSGWIVCDGAALNDVASPIWNAASRFLPNLTDSRFLMGSTAGGSIGGQSSTTITSANLPLHAHDMAHTHGAFTSGGMSANTTHTHGYTDPGHTHGTINDIDHGKVLGTSGPVDPGGSYGFAVATNGRGTTWGTGLGLTGITIQSSANLDHTHQTTIGAYAGSTGNGGFANTAIENRPLYLSVFYIVRYK